MLDIILVCLIIVAAMVLFVSERLRVDMVAILIMTALIVIGLFRPGFMTVQEGISGFSNKATITIAAMFILSSGIGEDRSHQPDQPETHSAGSWQ